MGCFAFWLRDGVRRRQCALWFRESWQVVCWLEGTISPSVHLSGPLNTMLDGSIIQENRIGLRIYSRGSWHPPTHYTYKGMQKDTFVNFKHLRKTTHTHNPVDDARGNAEALLQMKEMGLKISFA